MKHLTGFLALFLYAALPLYAAGLDDLTWTTTNGEVTITDCDTDATGELVIPDTIAGNPVTSIGESAFFHCTSLTSVTIGDGVTSIGERAFYFCSSLTNITIGNSVTSIGNYAFAFCRSLTSITIPDGVTCIEQRAFWGCSSLTSITIPDSVTSIGEGAFYVCSSLTSITIPNTVTSIGIAAFYNCSSLTSVTIGYGVSSIDDGAFERCSSLTSITIPDSVTRIGIAAFYVCSSLTSITIPDSVTSIGGRAFLGCTSLTNITIPDSVTGIGTNAFYDCSSLTSITFEGPAPALGLGVFFNIPKGAAAYVSEEFADSFGGFGNTWEGLIIRPEFSDLTWTTTDGEVTITDCDIDATGELVIPETIEGNPVTSIGNYAFAFCRSLTSITIPDGVTCIEQRAFWGCSSLTSITIPDSVTSIGEGAFFSCTSLTSITFEGPAPPMGLGVFLNVPKGAAAYVSEEFAGSFGGFGSTWEGLLVSSSVRSTIRAAIVAGSGTVEGVGIFTNGTSVTLTATPAAGQVFIAWTGDVSGSENPLTLTVEGDINIGAIFIEPAAHGLVTQESFNEVEAERDARFTEDQIRALSADYTIGLNDAGNVQMKFNLFESTDLNTFAPLTLNPDSVSVVDGSICLEFAPEDRAAFFRFSVE